MQMAFDQILSGMAISASGLAGERTRMDVAATNIANASSTRSSDGGPFRRQQVVFASEMNGLLQRPQGSGGGGGSGSVRLGGVRVVGIQNDPAPSIEVYDPGHPDANAHGIVEMPNVSLPREMVDLMTSGRAYEANLKALESYRQSVEQSLMLLRGLS